MRHTQNVENIREGVNLRKTTCTMSRSSGAHVTNKRQAQEITKVPRDHEVTSRCPDTSLALLINTANNKTMSGIFTDCPCATCSRDREAGGTAHQAAAIRLVGLGSGHPQWCLYQRVRASMELDMLARERSMNPR